METKEILTEIRDGVGWITLNRPEVLNAFTDPMRESLLGALEQFSDAPEVRCVVITGAGRAFCAGGDVASMAKLQDENETEIIERRMVVGGQVVQLLRRMRQPIIAAVNGPAAGAGANLALACDIRLGSDKAVLSESFVKIGLVPDWGGFYFLPQLVGTAKALELMMSGDRLGAQDAKEWGLFNHVFAPETFHEAVRQYAEKIAQGPLETLSQIKAGVYLGATESLEQALAFEHRTQKGLFLSADAREGMKAFLDKRVPQFNASASND